MAEHLAQGFRVELGVPGTVRLVVLAQHAHETVRELVHLLRVARFVGTYSGARLRHLQMREIDRVAGPELGFGYVERQLGAIIALSGS